MWRRWQTVGGAAGSLWNTSSSTCYNHKRLFAAATSSTLLLSTGFVVCTQQQADGEAERDNKDATDNKSDKNQSGHVQHHHHHHHHDSEFVFTCPSPRDIADTHGLHLRQIIILMRHGDRTPLAHAFGTKYTVPDHELEYWMKALPDPTELQRLDSKHPVVAQDTSHLNYRRIPFGLLTAKGGKQAYSLGALLRERYHELVQEALAQNAIYARSSNVGRTRQTAQHFFGWLDPTCVAIEAVHAKDEILLPNSGPPCPRHDELLHEITELGKEHPTECTATHMLTLEQRLGEIYGMTEDELAPTASKVQRTFAVTNIHETIKCRDSHGLSMLHGLDHELAEAIIKCHDHYWNAWYEHKELHRLAIGRLIDAVHKRMKSRITGDDHTRVALYSAHDTTVLPFLHAFEVADRKWPTYAANIVLELWERDADDEEAVQQHKERHYVRMMYNGNEVTLPGCHQQVLCPFSRFEELSHRAIPINYEEECKPRRTTTTHNNNNHTGDKMGVV